MECGLVLSVMPEAGCSLLLSSQIVGYQRYSCRRLPASSVALADPPSNRADHYASNAGGRQTGAISSSTWLIAVARRVSFSARRRWTSGYGPRSCGADDLLIEPYENGEVCRVAEEALRVAHASGQARAAGM